MLSTTNLSPNQHKQPNWGLHLTPLRGAGEAGRYALNTRLHGIRECINVIG